ncbi:dolichyl-phosphate beta-glucosyltransferase [bacterium]
MAEQSLTHTEPAFLNIVIPCCNEEARIEKSIKKIIDFCNSRQYSFKIILVDDGSTDNTKIILEKYKALYPDIISILYNQKNEGKGFSVKKGMLEADAEIALFTDADLSTPIEDFEKLKVFLLEKNYDIAIGSRNIDKSPRKTAQGYIRSAMGKIFSYIVRFVMFPDIYDTQCGFKAFKKHCIKNIFKKQTIKGFGFDPEILYLALKQGYRIHEVPVIWENDSRSKVNIFKDPLKMMINLIILWFKNGKTRNSG